MAHLMAVGVSLAVSMVLAGCIGWWVVLPLSVFLLRRACVRAQYEVVMQSDFSQESSLSWVFVGDRSMGAILANDNQIQNRCISVLLCIAPVGMAALVGQSMGCVLALLACTVCMSALVWCDCWGRLMPIEACVGLALFGGVYQLLRAGFMGVVAGIWYAVIIVGVCLIVRFLMDRCGGKEALGWGDIRCMGALALTSGWASPLGFVVSYAAAALYAGVKLLARQVVWGEKIPLAPFLYLWLLTLLC